MSIRTARDKCPKIVRLIGRYARLPANRQLLLLEAASWLGAAQLALRLIPFRWIALTLGAQDVPSSAVGPVGPNDEVASNSTDHEMVRRMSAAIRTTARHLPWNPTCLARALAAKAMLDIRGKRSRLRLGVARDRGSALEAHAWLEADGIVLTGGAEAERYHVVASFG